MKPYKLPAATTGSRADVSMISPALPAPRHKKRKTNQDKRGYDYRLPFWHADLTR